MTTPSGVNYNPGKKLGNINSSADYTSSDTNVFVTISDDHEGTVTDAGSVAEGGEAIGIMVNKPNTGEPMELIINGTAPLLIGSGGVSAGDIIKSDANGAGIIANADKDVVCAIAIQDGAEDDIIEVLIVHAWAGV